MKVGKKEISWLLILAMLLSLLPTVALAAEPIIREDRTPIETEKTDSIVETANQGVSENVPEPIKVKDIEELLQAIEEHKNQTDELYIKLLYSCYFKKRENKPVIIPADMKVTLDLNGNRINAYYFPKTDKDGVFGSIQNYYPSPVRVYGTLTLKDSKGYGGYEKSAAWKGAVHVYKGGVFNLEGGKITNNPEYTRFIHIRKGGGVYVEDGGTFNMNGGTISCSSKTYMNYGGGVYVEKGGTFNMNGGEIKDCILQRPASNIAQGGGVYNEGTFNMNGGKILNCTTGTGMAKSDGGGGVFNAAGGTFQMKGGIISGCLNDDYTRHGGHYPTEEEFLGGGGVFNLGTFIMDGGTITQNSSPRTRLNGVANNGCFIMNGGLISDNNNPSNLNVGYYGGKGVTNGAGSNLNLENAPETVEFTMNGGTISGNRDYGIYNTEAMKHFTMTGGTVTGSNIGVYSKGIPVTASNAVLTKNGSDALQCAQAKLENCTITSNGGSGVFCTSAELKGCTITSNKGGAVACKSGEMTDCTIEENGFGVSCGNEGPLTVTDCRINRNISGGVYKAGGTLTVTGGEICENYLGISASAGCKLSWEGGKLCNNGERQDVLLKKGCTLQKLGTIGTDWVLKQCGHPITGWFHDEDNARWAAAKDGKMCAGQTVHCVPFLGAEEEGIVDPETGALTRELDLKAAHEHEEFSDHTIQMKQRENTIYPGGETELLYTVENTGTQDETDCRVDIVFPAAAGDTIKGLDRTGTAVQEFESEFSLYPTKAELTGAEGKAYSILYYIGDREYDAMPAETEGHVTRISVLLPELKMGEKQEIVLQVRCGEDTPFAGENKTGYVEGSAVSKQVERKYASPAAYKTTDAVYHSVTYRILNDRISVGDKQPYYGVNQNIGDIVKHNESMAGVIRVDNARLQEDNYRSIVQSYVMGGKPVAADNLALGDSEYGTLYEKFGGFRILHVTDDVVITLDLPAYCVEHYKQQPDGTYELVQEDTQKIYGEVNKAITVEPRTYEDYQVNTEKSQLSGVLEMPTVDEDGQIHYMTLKVYYDIDPKCYLDVVYTDKTSFPEDPAFEDQTYKVLPGMPTPQFEGEPAREDYVFMGWSPAVEQTVSKSVVYSATWEKVVVTTSYTVTYYYDDVQKNAKTADGEVGGVVTEENLQLVQQEQYALDRVENVPLTLTPDAAQNQIRVYYAKDVIGPDGGSDGIPDKYQAMVTYKVVGGVFADQSAVKGAVFTLWEKVDGVWKKLDNVTLGSTIPTDMQPAAGYQSTGHWKEAIDENTEVTGNAVYTYAFRKAYIPRPDSKPDPKPESHVPGMLNGADHFAYVNGYEDGTVRPNANITRAEVASIFFRLLNEDVRDRNLTKENVFTDSNVGDWYNTAVSTMSSLGILKGRTEETFAPNAPITRAEFAAIAARFDRSGLSGTADFTDVSGHWAEQEIRRATALGWIKGYADGSFHPDAPITRAEAMTIINRVLERLPETEHDLLPGMRNWTDNPAGSWFYLAVQEATNSHTYTHKDRVPHETWNTLTPDLNWSRYE